MSSASQAGAARPSRAASRASNAPEPAGPRAPSRAGTQHEEEQVEETLTAASGAFLGDGVPARPELTGGQVISQALVSATRCVQSKYLVHVSFYSLTFLAKY